MQDVCGYLCAVALQLALILNVAHAIPIHGYYLNDVDEAQQLARQTGRELLVVFIAEGSQPARMMEFQTLNHPQIQERLLDCLKVKINTGMQPELFERFGLRKIPTLILYDSEGRELDRMAGFCRTSEFQAFFESAHDPNQNFQGQIRRSEADPSNFDRNEKLLKEYIQRGYPADALILLEKMIRDTPEEDSERLAEFYFLRPKLLIRAAQLEQALQALDDFMERFPFHEKIEDCYFEKANIYVMMSRQAEAKKVLEEFIEKYPASPRAKYARDLVDSTF